jgi:hypothetical protein
VEGELIHTDDTIQKVFRGMKRVGLTDRQVIDAVHAMQANGVYFREAKPEGEHERILPDYPYVLEHEMMEAIFVALGAASMCWESMEKTGIFNSRRAQQIGDELMEIANRYAAVAPDPVPEGGA